MNNEPVAWIDPKELDMDVSTSVTKHKQFDTDIPLYIHPAKTLTDEEIESEWFNVFKFEAGIGKNITNGVYEFARNISKSKEFKKLTDKDISDVISNQFQHKFNGYEICFLYAFARAILRKAQEK